MGVEHTESRFCGVVLLLFVAFVATGCIERPAEPRDRQLLITVRDLEPYGIRVEPEEESQEVLQRLLYLDRSLEIDYEYDSPEGAATALYLAVTAGFERSAADAEATFIVEREAFGIGARFGGLEVVEQPDFYRRGDSSFFAQLQLEQNPVGNVFLMQDGARTYGVVLTGLYFDVPEAWRELLDPRLDLLESYEP